MDVAIEVALIAAIPATVAGTAAWWNAAKTNRRTATTNGRNLGQLAEANFELARATSRRLDEVSASLEAHIQDPLLHLKNRGAGGP